MKQKTRDFLSEFAKEKGEKFDTNNDVFNVVHDYGNEISDTLVDSDKLARTQEIVKEIGGVYIRYRYICPHKWDVDRDTPEWDACFERYGDFTDFVNGIVEVEPFEETVTSYREVKSN